MSVRRGVHKSPGGLIRCEVVLCEEGEIVSVVFSGDFFMYPEEALEEVMECLRGLPCEKEVLLSAIKRVYAEAGIQAPGCEPGDFVTAVMRAVGDE